MKIVELEYSTGNETIVIIENKDGSETSMPKSIYDEMIAAQNEAAPQ